MEDKLEIRDENIEHRKMCAKDLDEYDLLERQKRNLEKKIEEIKSEIKISSIQVQQARDKINKLIENMTSMGSAAANRTPKAQYNFNKLNQLSDRLANHNLL